MCIRRSAALLVGIAVLGFFTACGKDGGSSSDSSVSIKAGDDACEVDNSSVPAGKTSFTVENTGSDVTEVYVYGKDGDEFTKIMGEVENIGPGTKRDFEVSLSAGDYQVACKPGMVGDGMRTDLTVTGDATPS